MFDISFILSDPLLSSTFDVIRRVEAVGANGRGALTPSTIPAVVGVVTPTDPSKIVRDDGSTMAEHAIEINSSFVFRDATGTFQPDQIVWKGRTYTVHAIYPFSHFGKGHQRVIAITQKPTDPVQF